MDSVQDGDPISDVAVTGLDGYVVAKNIRHCMDYYYPAYMDHQTMPYNLRNTVWAWNIRYVSAATPKLWMKYYLTVTVVI